jgi:hypothetical protein
MNAIHWLVDRFHVGTPDADIEADMIRRTKGATKAEQRKVVKIALKRHHDNQKLYNQVMTGRF